MSHLHVTLTHADRATLIRDALTLRAVVRRNPLASMCLIMSARLRTYAKALRNPHASLTVTLNPA